MRASFTQASLTERWQGWAIISLEMESGDPEYIKGCSALALWYGGSGENGEYLSAGNAMQPWVTVPDPLVAEDFGEGGRIEFLLQPAYTLHMAQAEGMYKAVILGDDKLPAAEAPLAVLDVVASRDPGDRILISDEEYRRRAKLIALRPTPEQEIAEMKAVLDGLQAVVRAEADGAGEFRARAAKAAEAAGKASAEAAALVARVMPEKAAEAQALANEAAAFARQAEGHAAEAARHADRAADAAVRIAARSGEFPAAEGAFAPARGMALLRQARAVQADVDAMRGEIGACVQAASKSCEEAESLVPAAEGKRDAVRRLAGERMRRRMPLIAAGILAVAVACGGAWWYMDTKPARDMASAVESARKDAESARAASEAAKRFADQAAEFMRKAPAEAGPAAGRAKSASHAASGAAASADSSRAAAERASDAASARRSADEARRAAASAAGARDAAEAEAKAAEKAFADYNDRINGAARRVAEFFLPANAAKRTPEAALALADDLRVESSEQQDAVFRLYDYAAEAGSEDAALRYAACFDPSMPAWGTIKKDGSEAWYWYGKSPKGAEKRETLRNWAKEAAAAGNVLAARWLRDMK